MNKRIFLIIAVSLLIVSTSLANDKPKSLRPPTFAELWDNLAYYQTNAERSGFGAVLARSEGKFGVNLFRSPLQVYGAYAAVVSDDPNYWNNILYTGIGARFKPFESFHGRVWANEWLSSIKVFYENLNSGYLKDQVSAEAANLAKTDVRYGVDIWHEWNIDNADRTKPWGELWLNWAYRETNFGWEEFKSTVCYFQPKFGWHLHKGIGVYLKADYVATSKQGTDYYFLNMLNPGVGIRFEPFRDSQKDNIFRKFKMFAEVLSVSYLKNRPTDPNKDVSSDVRFGIDFSYGR